MTATRKQGGMGSIQISQLSPTMYHDTTGDHECMDISKLPPLTVSRPPTLVGWVVRDDGTNSRARHQPLSSPYFTSISRPEHHTSDPVVPVPSHLHPALAGGRGPGGGSPDLRARRCRRRTPWRLGRPVGRPRPLAPGAGKSKQIRITFSWCPRSSAILLKYRSGDDLIRGSASRPPPPAGLPLKSVNP